MFRVSRRLDYGIQLLIALASSPENRLHTTGSLAEKLNIPLPFLYQISHTLIRSGLIKAHSGPHGGLQLNKPVKQITILQIVQAIDGPLTINPCLDTDTINETACTTASMWQSLEDQINNFFGNTTLNTLLPPSETG